MDLGDAVRTLLAREGLSQKQLADMAEISQSTVSRAVNQRPLRHGSARARLVIYMQERGIALVPDETLRAVTEIWDGSDAHAAALAELVRASRELWPNLARE